MALSPLSRAQGCVLLRGGTLATGHQQLGWIALACSGRGRQISGTLGVASATDFNLVDVFLKDLL